MAAAAQTPAKRTLTLTGDLTIYEALEVKHTLINALSEAQELEINLSDVSALDTAGFQILYLAKREALAMGKVLSLVAHSAATREVLDLYHMNAYFGDPVVIPAERESVAPQVQDVTPAPKKSRRKVRS